MNKCILVKPYIVGDGLTNLVVKKGQVIKYDIKYGGEPEPEVTWFRDTTELYEDKEQRLYSKTIYYYINYSVYTNKFFFKFAELLLINMNVIQ